jgi:hypothetical protein
MTYERNKKLREAAVALGHQEPISIEPDGVIWLGIDPERTYLSDSQQKAVEKKALELVQSQVDSRSSALAKLAALGLTQAEITALLGV